jgi:hypothetical protein
MDVKTIPNTPKVATVGDMKKALLNLPDNLPLIYSCDDEGNEYQFVMYRPSTMHVTTTGRNYRKLVPVTPHATVGSVNNKIKCVCIN